MRARIVDSLADGAAAGAGIAFLLNLLDWGGRLGLGNIEVFEQPHLKVLGSSTWVIVRIFGEFLLRWTGPATLVAVLVLTRRPVTKGPTLVVVALVVAIASGWVAALTCSLTYALDPTLGLLSPLVALMPSAVLARWARWPTAATVVLAAGIGCGALAAQSAFVFQSSAGYVIQPFYVFGGTVALTVVVSWIVLKFAQAERSAYGLRFVRALGLSAVSVSAIGILALESDQLRPRQPAPASSLYLNENAYDVHITGEPPALIWTNRKHTEVVENVYTDQSHRHFLEGTDMRAERVWGEVGGGFYVQYEPDTGWWRRPPPGQPIPEKATSWLRIPNWGDGTPIAGAFGEDAIRQRFLTFSEFDSHYAVIDLRTSEVITKGTLPGFWPWWHVVADQSARVWFVSSAMDGGWLYVLDFDKMEVVRKQSGIYFYEAVVDAKDGLLWGARPLTGELMGVDAATLAVRHRVEVEPTVRDIQIDEDSGDLFTCSFMSGNIYRVSRRTLAAEKIGWCGRLCRNLYLDSPRHTLWVATVDAICRIPLDGAAAAEH